MTKPTVDGETNSASQSAETPEEEARRLIVELRLLEGTAEALQSRINFLNAAFNELTLASKTLEGIEKENVNASIFVPIGGGSYIKASLSETDRVVYGIGAGVAIEKSISEAKDGIANRLSQIERTRQALEQQLTQVFHRIQEDQNRIQELSRALRTRER
ncbi:MAG: prefoldin subunit alpha [Nitrososphaerota archaeon]|nr:prefoldin subunit alpha [Candidatus Bathyarchaeota archaeon]MDW8048826.1 prefoldin subunit alpha [Nitrososphaerota archaeon]